MARPTVLQWMAARAMCEGAPSTKGRVAVMLGVDVSAVFARAAAESWQCIDWRSGRIQALQRELVAANAANAAEQEPGGTAWPTGGSSAGQGAETRPGEGVQAPGLETNDSGGAATDPADGIDPVDGIDPMDRALDGAAFVASARASGEGVAERLPMLDGADPVAVLAEASAFVVRQVALLIERAERTGGRLDRKQIDGLWAFARMMERWETLARERVKEEEVSSDEELALSLRLIDERILEKALDEARRMVAAGIVGRET